VRTVVALAGLAFALSACASYGAPDGDANYDAMKAATDQCQAKGGHLQLKAEHDGRTVSDYECKIGGAS
jgi:ABC-type glycerol-3-phosphate transport system substrate-binding protein